MVQFKDSRFMMNASMYAKEQKIQRNADRGTEAEVGYKADDRKR